jgi:hypothetical protein
MLQCCNVCERIRPWSLLCAPVFPPAVARDAVDRRHSFGGGAPRPDSQPGRGTIQSTPAMAEGSYWRHGRFSSCCETATRRRSWRGRCRECAAIFIDGPGFCARTVVSAGCLWGLVGPVTRFDVPRREHRGGARQRSPAARGQ